MPAMGRRVKQLLRVHQKTQKQLAASTGMAQSTLSDIIHGRKEPGLLKARLIAEFFDVDLHWLVFGKSFTAETSSTEKVSENSARKTYNAARDLADEVIDRRRDYQPKHMAELITLLKTLDEEERHLILEMVRRLRRKK